LEQLLQQLKLTPETKKDTKKEKKDHPFWNSQPVLDYRIIPFFFFKKKKNPSTSFE